MHLLKTHLFLIPAAVMILSEFTKVGVDWWKTGHIRLFRSGGMPSSHSAFVTSLAIMVGRRLGLDSPEFAISFVLASIVCYDSMSSRKAIGQQAKVLNKLQDLEHLKEQLGHSGLEVFTGILFGVVVTMVGVGLM
jgi:acid phosphatase family membrane protein YuiD